MNVIIGQGILVIYCFITVLLIPADTALVVSFLVSVICMSAANVAASHKVKCGALVLYLLFSCFAPKLLIFAPAVLYSILECKQYFAGILLGILCVFFYFQTEPKVLFLLLFGGALAFILQYQTEHYRTLEDMFRKTRDDERELNFLLEEKNKNILQKQDYEIYTATLRERNRIAREIHDNVGHMLSRAILMVGAMKAVSKEAVMEEPLKQLEDTLNTAMTNVRESVHDLHDDSVNLKEVLEGLTKEFAFCKVCLTYDMGYTLPREVKYSFIAIVKEALNNVIKHSNATQVEIVAREHPGLYQLMIEDNGNVSNLSDSGTGGIGIQNMKERIRTLDGTFQVRAKNGFRIHITVPKKEETA